MSDSSSQSHVIGVEVSMMCKKSFPCKHKCYAIMSDNQKVALSTLKLIEEPYWSLLSESQQNHFAYLHDLNNPVVVGVEVSSMCMETYPCQHQCYALMSDGEKVRISTRQLIDEPFWSFLSKDDQNHFAYFRNL
jgi:hypothetical protein